MNSKIELTAEQISKVARAMSDREADTCAIDREDNWKNYSSTYIDDIKVVLEAIGRAEAQAGEAVAEVIMHKETVGFGRLEPRKTVRFLADVPVGVKLYTAPQQPEPSAELSDALLTIGYQMSNVMYNHAQRVGGLLTQSQCDVFEELYTAWDVAKLEYNKRLAAIEAKRGAGMNNEERECETCEGKGTIDERLGGYSDSNPEAKCPDCDGAGYWVDKSKRGAK